MVLNVNLEGGIMNKRLLELDSLRGLAALSVVFSHFINVFPQILDTTYNQNSTLIKLLKYTPLHIFWTGHESVVFFFILSGFVLFLPFLKKDEGIFYPAYLVKRVCRIYIPYIIALIFALSMNYLYYRGGISELSSWFNLVGQSPANPMLIIQHFFLIGSFNNNVYNPVLWSLVYEMRISIVFPIVAFLVIKYNWKINLMISIILSACGLFGNDIINKLTNSTTDYLLTLHYVSMFIIGALLAKNRDEFVKKFSANSRCAKILLLLVAILAYTNYWWTFLIKPFSGRVFHIVVGNDWVTALGVIIFIIIGFSSMKVSNFLNKKPIVLLGKISYSLYLYHAICLVTMINVLYDITPFWAILVLALISSVVIASLSYFLIEVNSIRLGRYLSRKIQVVNRMQADNHLSN